MHDGFQAIVVSNEAKHLFFSDCLGGVDDVDADGVGGVVTTTEMMSGGRQQDEDMTVWYGRVVTSTVLARRRNIVGPADRLSRYVLFLSNNNKKINPDNRT
mmetsp:Transcript_13030/g.14675  ORF Transcript_13030/g.14675 Transcript_13030/m.14675 type:complete len:101 (+) Transcript_13030:461-763(+)